MMKELSRFEIFFLFVLDFFILTETFFLFLGKKVADAFVKSCSLQVIDLRIHQLYSKIDFELIMSSYILG